MDLFSYKNDSKIEGGDFDDKGGFGGTYVKGGQKL